MKDILADLNAAQHEAVTAPDGPVLVVAGAGSGKTRVLTTRVAWLLGEKGVRPGEILAFTFTNRAAKEMRERVAGSVGENQACTRSEDCAGDMICIRVSDEVGAVCKISCTDDSGMTMSDLRDVVVTVKI